MNDREVKRYEMFNRVVTFGHDNAADFAADSKAAGLFAQLAAVLQQVDAARTGQMGRRATARAVLLDALRIDLKNIVRTAREIEDDQPGFADRFRMPAGSSQTALLTAANRMLEDLQKDGVAGQFIAYEMPETFVTDLAADLKTINETRDEENSGDRQAVENTAVLGAAIDAGLKIVGQLNASMYNKYTRQNPAKLTAWKSASHTERVARRTKTATPAPAATAKA